LYKGYFCKIVAEPLRIKGSDGKTYLNPKANRDFLARFIDGFGQFLSGDSYGPDFNMYGRPVKQISLDKFEVPVVETSSDLPEKIPTPSTPQQFDNTLEGQYQRYFQTPEFNNVFGARSRGEGAPKDASAMQELGNQLRAPEKDTNIASMYASQSALGRVNQDEIQNLYAGDENMQAWAKENPMLAQREYLKAEQRRANEIGNERERVQLDNPMGKEAYDLIKKQLLNKAAAQ